jgi:hypothetical protein
VKTNISLDVGLLGAIDDAAAAHGLTRSAFLATTAKERSGGREQKIYRRKNLAKNRNIASPHYDIMSYLSMG